MNTRPLQRQLHRQIGMLGRAAGAPVNPPPFNAREYLEQEQDRERQAFATRLTEILCEMRPDIAPANAAKQAMEAAEVLYPELLDPAGGKEE